MASFSRLLGLGVALLLFLLSVGCGQVAHVRPTAKGKWDGEVSLGGPLTSIPGVGTIPLPLMTVGASTGILDNLDLQAHLHLTPIVFGVAGVDVASTWQFLNQKDAIPAVSVTGRLYGFTDAKAVSGDLEIDAAASWLYAKRWMTYVQPSAFVQFAGGPVLPNLALGESVRVGRTEIILEGRWYNFVYSADNHVASYANIGHVGALGVVGGVRIHFGDQR